MLRFKSDSFIRNDKIDVKFLSNFNGSSKKKTHNKKSLHL